MNGRFPNARTCRPWLAAVALIALVAGCSNSSADRSAVSGASSGPETVAESTSGSVVSDGFDLVAIGDSLPGGLQCDAPCRPYPEVLGELAAAALGVPVAVSNLATNDSLLSTELLRRVMSEDTYRAALAKADAVVVQVGFNDWQSTCYWSGHEECVAAGAEQVRVNLRKILDAVSTLTSGHATTVWVVGYYDNTIGDPNVFSNWSITTADESAFHDFYSSALTQFNGMLCDVAEQHDAVCVDVVEAFNGPSRDQDAGSLLGADHLHPSQDGHARIAALIDGAGEPTLG